MARSTARVSCIAILAVAGHAIVAELMAFVAPSASFGGRHLRSRVGLAASRAEVAEAEKQAKLLTWAARTTAAQGSPQAAAMQARADQAVAALEALKAGEAAPAPSAVAAAPVAAAPVFAAPVASAPVATGAVSKAEIAAAEKQAKLLIWAAKTTAAQGSPQAATMQAKADQAVAALEALKAGEAVATPATPAVVAAAPVAAAPVASAPVVAGSASKLEIAEAEKQAKLLSWAAKTTAAQGSPQAAMMQAKADQAVAAYEALKAGAAPAAAPAVVAAAPVAAAPVAARVAALSVPAAQGAPSKQELVKAKKELDLIMWAARVAAEKGVPQAPSVQARADAALAAYEAMEAAAAEPQAAFR